MVRVGVIGLGAFGEFQIQAMRGIPGIEIVAVASRSGDRAREIADRYGVAAAHDSADALCADPTVDAVLVATEESRHVAPTLAALAAGKHVLVEKPLATTREDVLTILAAAQDGPGTLMPGHIVRFEPRIALLKRQVEAGELGAIAAVAASRNRPRATLGIYERCHPALVTAIHDIDACLWLLGERPTSVRAWHRLERGDDGVYGIWGTFAFPSGAVASFEATWMMPNDSGLACGDTFAVTGTRGVAALDMGATGMRVLREGAMQVPELGYQPEGHDGIGGALQAELMHFALLASGRVREPVVTPLDGAVAVIAALAMVESAVANRETTIDWSGL